MKSITLRNKEKILKVQKKNQTSKPVNFHFLFSLSFYFKRVKNY